MVNKKRLIIGLIIMILFITATIVVDMRNKEREKIDKKDPLEYYIYYDKFIKPQIDSNLKPTEDGNFSGTNIIINKSKTLIKKSSLDYMLAIQDSFFLRIQYFDILKNLNGTEAFYTENQNKIKEVLRIKDLEEFDELVTKIKKIHKYEVTIDDESVVVSGNVVTFNCSIDNTQFSCRAIINKDNKSTSCIMYIR